MVEGIGVLKSGSGQPWAWHSADLKSTLHLVPSSPSVVLRGTFGSDAFPLPHSIIGSFSGALSTVPVHDLGTTVIKEVLAKSPSWSPFYSDNRICPRFLLLSKVTLAVCLELGNYVMTV